MSDERTVIREVAWRDLLPWLVLFRVFRTALSPGLLLLALAGVLATPIGWWGGRLLFFRPADVDRNEDLAAVVLNYGDWPDTPRLDQLYEPAPGEGGVRHWIAQGVAPYSDLVWERFAKPFWRLFSLEIPMAQFGYYLLGGLWTLLVWSVFGAAIARIAVVRLGRDERLGLGETLKYSLKRIGSYFSAPLFPLLGVVLLGVMMWPGSAMLIADWGVLVGGVLWGFVLLFCFLAALLLIGLMFGWPLMWAAIGAEERGDAFDALSRAFAYTFQRPLSYLFYAVLALALGGLGWLVVWHVAEGVIHLSYWFVSWGANMPKLWEGADFDRVAVLKQAVDGSLDHPPATLWIGGALIAVWESLLRLLAASFPYAYFWSAASAIYLLLRRDVDQTEMDDVFVSEEEEPESLPPLDQQQQASQPGESAESAGQGEEGGEQTGGESENAASAAAAPETGSQPEDPQAGKPDASGSSDQTAPPEGGGQPEGGEPPKSDA